MGTQSIDQPSGPGLSFELAVLGIAKALAPGAKVVHRARYPDRDTGTLREADVSVEGLVGGHWPIRILVSCKDHSRPLDIEAISAFKGQVDSLMASCGVLYSRSGFTAPAIAKARHLAITCCQLLEGEPPPIPDMVTIRWYVLQSGRLRTKITHAPPEALTLPTWGSVFSLDAGPAGSASQRRDLADSIEASHREADEQGVAALRTNMRVPPGQVLTLQLQRADWSSPLVIEVTFRWRLFEGLVEAFQLNGSYTVSEGTFCGSVATPWIDTQGEDPGPGWAEIPHTAGKELVGGVFLKLGPKVAAELREWSAPPVWP